MQGYIIGMVLTAVVGYWSLMVLCKIVLTKKMHFFSLYFILFVHNHDEITIMRKRDLQQ